MRSDLRFLFSVLLSFLIVQHETAKDGARSSHLRLSVFCTINLFPKVPLIIVVFILFGAFMVFVGNGTPSPLNLQVRIARFFRFSGIDSSSLHMAENGVSDVMLLLSI
ncbi:hypothetical protein DVH24_020293 [Malus domestica]|uniref:Uncharacterized protein n=1 Tax=Malus domestica TaxID=3750 RepID=A0A498J6X4_MALDO|nr:hypothetical protein DVH24_020293 [Malus domestica]